MHEAAQGLSRFARLPARLRRLAAPGAGAAVALGQAPWGLWPLALLGLAAGLVLLLGAPSLRTAFRTGWAFGTGYFALALFWIVEPFFVDPLRHGWMAPFAILLMAGGLALFWGAAFAGARALGPSAGRIALGWAAALALAEWLRGVVLTGLPWAAVGHIWIDTPAVHWAALGGPALLTFATLLAVAAGWRLALMGRAGLAAAVLPVVALLGGGVALAPPQVPPAPEAPVLRLVQPNAPQHLKWDPAHWATFYRRQLDYTAATPAPDLVIWPESAIPWLLEDAAPALSEIAAAAGGVPVVLGVTRSEGILYYNSAVVVDAAGAVAALYDKHHLVPFGEYIPLGGLARMFGLRGMAARDGYGFSAGEGPAILDLGAAGRALPLICYEAIFPRHARLAGDRPDFLLQVTNDAWFGEISGPYQHLAQARLRAVEQGLPMVRVANTGVSAVIDAGGRVTAAIPLGEHGYRDVALPPALPPTPYALAGDLPVIVVMLATLAGLAGLRRFSD